MGDDNPGSSLKKHTLNQFSAIEVDKVADAILSISNLRVQIGSFFGIVNLSAMSFCFTTKKVSIAFFAAAALWVFILIDIIVVRTLIGYIYRGLELEGSFGKDNENSYFRISMLFLQNSRIKKLEAIRNKSLPEQLIALRKLPLYYPPLVGFWIPLIGSIMEIVLGFALINQLEWDLF